MRALRAPLWLTVWRAQSSPSSAKSTWVYPGSDSGSGNWRYCSIVSRVSASSHEQDPAVLLPREHGVHHVLKGSQGLQIGHVERGGAATGHAPLPISHDKVPRSVAPGGSDRAEKQLLRATEHVDRQRGFFGQCRVDKVVGRGLDDPDPGGPLGISSRSTLLTPQNRAPQCTGMEIPKAQVSQRRGTSWFGPRSGGVRARVLAPLALECGAPVRRHKLPILGLGRRS